jgi:hypothetical protein
MLSWIFVTIFWNTNSCDLGKDSHESTSNYSHIRTYLLQVRLFGPNGVMRPALEKVGLEWATFQAMRRTHSTVMKQLKADPKLVAN